MVVVMLIFGVGVAADLGGGGVGGEGLGGGCGGGGDGGGLRGTIAKVTVS